MGHVGEDAAKVYVRVARRETLRLEGTMRFRFPGALKPSKSQGRQNVKFTPSKPRKSSKPGPPMSDSPRSISDISIAMAPISPGEVDTLKLKDAVCQKLLLLV